MMNPNNPPDTPVTDVAGMPSIGDLFRAPPEEDFKDGMPTEIRDIFDEFGLGERSYQCMVKRRPGPLTPREVLVRNFTNEYPSLEYVAREWGPGEYILVFTWRVLVENSGGKYKNHSSRLTLDVSDDYQDLYDDFQLRKQIARAEKNNDMIRKAKLQRLLTISHDDLLKEDQAEKEKANAKSPAEAGKEYVQNIMESAQMLGLHKQDGGGIAKIMEYAMPVLPVVMQMINEKSKADREYQNNMLMMMMNLQSKSTEQMMSAMTSIHKPTSGNEMIKDVMDMMVNAIDFKKAINGEDEKESTIDKVFGLLEKSAPIIMTMAQMSAQKRQSNPMYQFAKQQVQANPEVQAVMSDPEMLAEMVKRCDNFYGWKQTDDILTVMGISRPESCPREEGKELPSGQNDEDSSIDESEEIQDGTC